MRRLPRRLPTRAVQLPPTVGDLVSGRGILFTPTLLGRVLFEGPPDTCGGPIGGAVMLGYAALHLVTLVLFGLLASYLVSRSEKLPSLWFGGLMLFVIVAWHLGAAVLTVLGPAAECTSLWWMVAGSFAGALAMAGYLWRAHPGLRAQLRTDHYA